MNLKDDKNWYEVTASKDEIKKERQKTRALKQDRWWKQKISEGLCYYCGKKFLPEQLTMDHIVPIARGGKTNKRNVVVSCFECNQNKGLNTVVDSILSKKINS